MSTTTPGTAGPRPRVTVVVPLYNPGEYLDPCLESLAAQTMAPEDLEILLVDDGSTDDTLERARAFEAAHANVRVIPIPNSGWPGKPRNIGTDEARGEYVMYVDQDDRVEPDALERMTSVGAAHGSDVVIGKVISDFRGVNHEVYREDRPSCTVHDAPLMESLTPHKAFRRDFLREHGIRYPEGPRRLEDQLFMAQAYFAAGAATIVSDRVCYRYLRRPDGGNAGSKRFDPAVYYANLAEVLDVVDAHVPPGRERDDFYRRFLRVELLGRLGGKKALRHDDEYLDALLREVRGLLDGRFADSVAAGMGAAMRSRTGVVRRGTRDDVRDLARRYNAVKAVAMLVDQRVEGSAQRIDVEVRWTFRGDPLVLDRVGDRLALPRSVVGSLPTDDERRVDDQLDTIAGDVVVKHRSSLDEWFVGPRLTGGIEDGPSGPEVVLRGSVLLDAATAALGHPLRDGVQDLYVRVGAFAWARSQRLGADRAGGLVAAGPSTDSSGRVVLAYDTDPHGNLSLDVAPGEGGLRERVRLLRVASATPTEVVLAAASGPGPTLRPRGSAGEGWTSAAGADGRLRATGPALPTGTHRLVVGFGGAEVVLETTLAVDGRGRVTVQAPAAATPAARPTGRPAWRRALSRLKRALGR
ncbi:glycosyltransferase family 2 protein [Phycicoccus sonneratiae]|uniref:Glycosyltransferase family 2 protein n=1 Tax=Phycicoccus sonneratiae TaxID=2807628 RepID=A0ABS2CM76_9MICO|nr:glycosyltransferase family A protein [Phycicoccus sonneraticus]MBM6400987.1 glycosyltransferase family 2 protein [Phycicoccus sonneraticus]